MPSAWRGNVVEISPILVGERCDLQFGIGKIQALLGFQANALGDNRRHACDHAPRFDPYHLGAQLAIIDEQAIADLDRT